MPSCVVVLLESTPSTTTITIMIRGRRTSPPLLRAIFSAHTVVLVRQPSPSPLSPALPLFSSSLAPSSFSALDNDGPEWSFSLTPQATRPDGFQHGESEVSLRSTSPHLATPMHADSETSFSSSTIPAIPAVTPPNSIQRRGSEASLLSATVPSPPLTPDFTKPLRFLSFFPRGLSLFSSRPRPLSFRASSSDTESEAQFTGPEMSRFSVRSNSSVGSSDSGCNLIDSGHHTLIKVYS
ncbi:hypothetical protein B0H14DRAFT_3454134 [Mycena olivaceomarginata]|nr:hypothetical protein B0H14DRAFT_3454134 [Mycena olivaceomarginata]